MLNLNRVLVGLWQRLARLPDHALGHGWGTVLHWQLVNFSQWFAVGFFIGVAACLLTLVAVTDLAFGWSTTLDLDAGWVWGLLDGLAWPWSWWLSAAAPDQALVEASRYYRLEGQAQNLQAARLGAWWPFVLMAMLFWGLLPRLVFVTFGSWRQRVAERRLLREHPEVSALLRRLAPPSVDYTSTPSAVVEPADETPAADAPPPIEGTLINWDNAIAAESALRVSSAMDSSTRREAIADLPRGDVALFTKGYEPPMLAVHDFIRELRAQLGPEATVVVLPRGVDGQAASATDLDIWRQSLAGLKDARVFVSEGES